MENAPYKTAFEYYRWPILFGAVYIAVVTLEAVYCSVPLAQYMRVGYALMLVAAKCVILLAGMGAVVYLRAFFSSEAGREGRVRFAHRRVVEVSDAYMSGEVFAYGCVGVLAIFAICFYFIQKSLINIIHPFAWDGIFIVWVKLLHFGHFPNDLLVPVIDALHLGPLLDITYFFWFGVMYMGLGYNLFWDNDRQRRLRYIWVFLMAWILLGSLMGVVFSAAGPAFYHDFFPNKPDPYAGFLAYIEAHGPHDFPIADHSRKWLLGWTTNGQKVNINAVAAFPSLHLAVAWLNALYGFSISRKLGIAGVIFTALIFMATILFGFHYALDGYVSIVLVSLLWWGMGKALARRYPPDTKPLKRA